MRWPEKQRQDFIQERIDAGATINRRDLMERFEISVAQASLDIKKYRKAHPGVLLYDHNRKIYIRGGKSLDLRVDSVANTDDFRSLSPNSPLPWSEYHTPEICTVVIVDANNVDVCTIKRGNFPDAMRIAGMILCAANTCGGIKMTES